MVRLWLEPSTFNGQTLPTSAHPQESFDFEVAEKMLRYFFDRVHAETSIVIPRPRVLMSVPLEVTEVERKAVGDAALGAGAREVYLVEEPIAAAVGSGVDISAPTGNMIVNIGAGSTEIAVISLRGVVTSKTIPIAGDELNRNIVQYGRDALISQGNASPKK